VSDVRAALLAGVDAKPGLAGKVASGGRLNAEASLRSAIAAAPGDVSDAPAPRPAPAPAPAAPAPAPRPGPPPPAVTSSPPATTTALGLGVSVASRQRLSRALRRGLRARMRCTKGCRLGVSVLLDRRSARRLRLGSGRRAVKVASGGARLGSAGSRTVTARFGRRSRARLRRVRSVRLTVSLSARSADGQIRRAKRRVLLRR
jgi:hypothetical protein